MKKVFAIILISFVLFSCSNSKFNNHNRSVFKYNESKGIPTLDPAFAKNQVVIWPTNQIFNGLVQLDTNLNIKSCIAKRWEINNSGKQYIFHLRQDVYFHDHEKFKNGKGRKVNAYDFEYSLNRIIDPKVASPGAWIFNNVEQNGIKALNDSTLQISLKNPFPAFLGLLSMQYCSVIPKEIVRYYGTDFRRNPVGTGPFMFKFWKEGEKLILVKNPHYFEKDSLGNNLPYLDAVSITFITDKQSEFLEFLKGNIDFISGLNNINKDELLTRNGKLRPKYHDKFQLINQPYLNTEYLGFLLDTSKIDDKSSPVLNKKVRQAINYGFDRMKMMKYLRNSVGIPATNGFIPKGLPSFNKKLTGYYYNPDKSRELLTEAGFPNGKGLKPIKLTTTNDYLDLCEYIQQQLSELGIEIQIDINTGATFREMVSSSKLEFFRGSWIADYPDAENYLALFYSKNFSPNGPNYTHYSNKIFDQLYEQALTEVDENTRRKLYNKMNKIIIEDAAIVPLYYDEVVLFANKDLEEFTSNPMNLLNLKTVKKIRNDISSR